MSERNMGKLRCELRNAESLEELRDIINELDGEDFAAVENDLCDMPTFGGEWPESTPCVFSWDHERLLVFAGDFEIVDRQAM